MHISREHADDKGQTMTLGCDSSGDEADMGAGRKKTVPQGLSLTNSTLLSQRGDVVSAKSSAAESTITVGALTGAERTKASADLMPGSTSTEHDNTHVGSNHQAQKKYRVESPNNGSDQKIIPSSSPTFALSPVEEIAWKIANDRLLGARVRSEFPGNGLWYWGNVVGICGADQRNRYKYEVLFQNGDIARNLMTKQVCTEE